MHIRTKIKLLSLLEAPTSPLLNTKSVRTAAFHGGSGIDQTYSDLLPRFEQIKSKFETMIKAALPNNIKSSRKTKFLSALKPLGSLKNKVLERGKGITSIGDIVRGALLLDSEADVNDAVGAIRRRLGNMVVGYEFKEKGNDPQFGYYGSHHLDIMIDGLVVELQVMTSRLWNYKGAAHEIYNKSRTDVAKGGTVNKADKYLSKKIFSMGNRPRPMKEDLDESEIWEYIEVVME